jgi:GDP-L-fucose synthase
MPPQNQPALHMAAKRVLVTGGAGFLGSHIVEGIRGRGCNQITAPRRSEFDLTRPENVEALFQHCRPQIIIHAAAVVGGIGANRLHPGKFFYENLIMGIQVIEACRRYGAEKVVVLGTICAYPKFTPVPFREESLWNGYPEETNAPYGIAKKALLVQCQAYREEYGLNAVYLLPVNLYGPGDNFHLESSHVIPALIRKCIEAKERGDAAVRVWGDGSPTREFLYVDDAADAILRATESYNDAAPVNIGSGEEIAIRDLAEMIAKLTGFNGRIEWETDKPNGQPRRCLEISRADREFGFRSATPLDEGLKRTIQWYRNTLEVQRLQPTSKG